jgi:hypothetical protein
MLSAFSGEEGQVGGHGREHRARSFEFNQTMLDKLPKVTRLGIDFDDDDNSSIGMLVPRVTKGGEL